MRMLRPCRGSAFRRQAIAMLAPSQTAAASSKLMPAGLCANAALSSTQTNSAWAPKPLTPKTWSPTSNSVTRCAHCLDLSGQLHAENPPLRPAEPGEDAGEERLRAAPAAIRPVDGRGVDPDEHLVRPWERAARPLRVAGRPATRTCRGRRLSSRHAAVEGQDDVAGLLLRLHVPVRLDDVLERVGPVDDGPVAA